MTFRTRSSVSLPPSLCFCKSLTSAVSLLAPGQSCWLHTTHVHTPSVIHVNPAASSNRQRGTGAASSACGWGRWQCLLSVSRLWPSSLPPAHSPARDCSASVKCSHFPGRGDRRLWYTVKHRVAGTILNVHYIHKLRSLLVPALSSINR